MVSSQPIEALQWLTYIPQKTGRCNSFRKWEVHPPVVPNVKVDGNSPKTKEVFEYLGYFGMCAPACPIDPRPVLTQTKHC